MNLNFHFEHVVIPDDVSKYDYADVYFQKDCILFECFYFNREFPSSVIRVPYVNDFSKGVSFDG